MVAASAPLLEPTSPPWAARFALRLQQMFWPIFPTQPMRVWDAGTVADLPPAADWPDCVAIASGEVWVSNGVAWVQPQMDAPTAPQFDNDNSIATTAWVNRVGHQFSSRTVVSANTVLNTSAAGALVIINTAGVAVTLPPAASFPSGTTISFTVQAGPVTVTAAGADVINMGGALPTTVTMNAADTLDLVSNGVNSWPVYGGSAQLAYGSNFTTAPQFDNTGKLATTAFVQRAIGNRRGLQGFGINTNLTAAHAGMLIVGGAPNIILGLPKINTMVDGAEISFYADAANVTVGVAGGDVISGGLASYVLNLGDTLTLVAKVAINQWYPQSGSVQLPNATQMSNWPIAPLFDTTGKLASAAFVQRALGNDAWAYAYGANTVLTSGQTGGFIICFSPMTTLTLPVSTGFIPGLTFDILAATALTVVAQGADTIHTGLASASTYAMAAGARRRVTYGYTNQWFAGS